MVGVGHLDGPTPGGSAGPERSSLMVRLGAVVVVALGGGWFALSHYVLRTPTVDALGETLGVVLGLLVVASVIGAVWSARRGAK